MLYIYVYTTPPVLIIALAEDLMELKQVLPLTCPITMLRVVIPAKGRLCSHIQAFDLATYIAFCNQAQVWNCPICQKPLPYHVRSVCY